jgi:hypothetical protein
MDNLVRITRHQFPGVCCKSRLNRFCRIPRELVSTMITQDASFVSASGFSISSEQLT